MASEWVWDSASRRYRNTKTGRWIGHKDVVKIRDEFALTQRAWADTAARALANKDWTVRRWEEEIRARLKRIYVAEYALGRGGRKNLTQSDYGRIGSMLREQYDYLRSFAYDVQSGKMTEAQIAARTQMYHESSIHAFERGKAASYSTELILPAYPADGGTRCRSRCRCRWYIRETKTAWKAYWKREHRAESCDDCVTRELAYNPYTVPKG